MRYSQAGQLASDLFESARNERIEANAPLAARMRPRTLDEFIGQEAIVGPGRLLRRAIQADQLSSLIFYGPPGTGKTTLAQVIANTTAAHFSALNAVLAGVKEIRATVTDAQERWALYDQGTILFVDEVHRFNKAQQDALLPWVENGTVTFIGATTENPYFEVNKALVSRSRIFQLKSLTEQHLRLIMQAALNTPGRGYGDRRVLIEEEAAAHLVSIANGDARAVLNALELAVETTDPDPSGEVRINLAIAEESIQRRAVLYDKEGDYHFDTISAFIKSLRGSDPDAALYWLAKMIYAGEDPRFILRRMLILASEDVGMADPRAVQVVNACAQAFDRVGLPEGNFPLAQAALYLATAEKSNSVMAFFDALDAVRNEPDSDVPSHLRDANRDSEGFGHGAGYLYPHAYRDHWVAQQYLPAALQGKVFYEPTDQGYEAAIAAAVTRRREAQLAAMLEGSGAPPEILTYDASGGGSVRERWLQRTVAQSGEAAAALRDRILAGGPLERHSVVLDLNAGSGLLTWEAQRRSPEGGVYALAFNEDDRQALQEQTQNMEEPARPLLLQGRIGELAQLLDADAVRFDAIVGRNALINSSEKEAALRQLAERLAPQGWLSLAETVPKHTQRIYALGDRSTLRPELAERLIAAEEAIYADSADALVNWDEDTMEAALFAAFPAQAQSGRVSIERIDADTDVLISEGMVRRWFGPALGDRRSYAERLAEGMGPEEVEQIEGWVRGQLLNRTVPWRRRTVLLRVAGE
ncbi:MAG: AAA family ATPase [Caldilineaceae bacterium]|nr:AAA family ATPase [Caldilineaceae bacterium]MDE0431069.1 AAA family ATPase [Caldilineaceae bacterium]